MSEVDRSSSFDAARSSPGDSPGDSTGDSTGGSAGKASSSERDRTVVVRLMGGLGNQLFQYACGRTVAESIGASLQVDLAGFSRERSRPIAGVASGAPETPRGYDLPRLGLSPATIDGRSASGATIADGLLAARGLWRLLRTLGRTRLRVGSTLGCFDRMDGRPPAAVPASVRCVVLRGYWQSRACFAPIEPALRRELLAWRDSDGGAALADDVVAIHVRRGDYRAPGTARMHPPLPREYYLAALDAIARQRSLRAAVIVSDEPARAVEELDLPLPIEAVNEANACLATIEADVRRMSRAGALIIANSSLSWWAGWLAEARGGIVVAPDPWFGPAGRAFAHPAPPEWERIRWHHR